jgi:hypothetical protein
VVWRGSEDVGPAANNRGQADWGRDLASVRYLAGGFKVMRKLDG